MANRKQENLTRQTCVPCEGGIPPLSKVEAATLLKKIPGWQIVERGKRIRKAWTVRNFMAGIDFIKKIAELAEAEGHHPDVHLERYREVIVEIWTHAIGGLSQNDFILAAKIDRLPVKLKSPTAS
jgi:4a-hydroxytetrahydrobiopterin dehydratase